MHRFIAAFFTTLFLTLTSNIAAAKADIEQACASLDRPNIDCQCVATRVSIYQRFAPTDTAKQMLAEQYKGSLGLPNDYENVAKAAYGGPDDMMQRMAIEESFDQLGGTPSGVEDLEKGCVIAGAEPISIAQPRTINRAASYSTQSYTDSCLAAIGDTDKNRRFCQCQMSRLTLRVTDQEFEAYYRSFTQYNRGPNRQNLSELRAQSMGISPADYERLNRSARAKIEPNIDLDEAYCNARIWADEKPGLDAEARQHAGFKPGMALVAMPAPLSSPSMMEGLPEDRARTIVRASCSKNGNSDAYCACYMRDFESRVVSQAANGNVTLAWALMQGDSAMTQMDYVATMQSLPREDHQAAGMMLMNTADIGETCSQGMTEVAPEPMQGTPSERMTAICTEQNENAEMCQCMTTQMQDRLSPDDFELIVDIREAEFQGADDPLAKVAEDRGLTSEEAEEALAMNRSMMSGVMGMDMMACLGGMGGMPNLSSIPGFPNQ
ncbi:MAG: hypothetical protein AAFQ15_01845 [Pseudomonadota bacterium]